MNGVRRWYEGGVWDRHMRFDYSARGVISRRYFAFKWRNESINLSERVLLKKSFDRMTRCRCLWIKQSFQVYLPPFESLLKFTELDEKDTVDFAVRLICRILNIFQTAHLSSTFIPLKLEEKFDRSFGSILQYLNRMISLSIPSVITFVRKSRFEKKKKKFDDLPSFFLSSFPFVRDSTRINGREKVHWSENSSLP